MSNDIEAVLHQAAPSPSTPFDFESALRRGRTRARWSRLIIVMSVVVAGATIWAGYGWLTIADRSATLIRSLLQRSTSGMGER